MNTTDTINEVIRRRAAEVRFWIGAGKTEAEAVAFVKASSTLGPKSWEAVLYIVRAA